MLPVLRACSAAPESLLDPLLPFRDCICSEVRGSVKATLMLDSWPRFDSAVPTASAGVSVDVMARGLPPPLPLLQPAKVRANPTATAAAICVLLRHPFMVLPLRVTPGSGV